MDKYLDFLEHNINTIKRGWDKIFSGDKAPFQIVEYSDFYPFPNVITYSTLGLSHTPLLIEDGGRIARHELFISLPSSLEGSKVAPKLQQVGLMILNRGIIPLRGEVIKRQGFIFEGYSFTSFYVSNPVYFSEEFGVYEGNETIIQISLYPITDSEVSFIETNGWSIFEDLLEENEVDLTDLSRESVI